MPEEWEDDIVWDDADDTPEAVCSLENPESCESCQ